MIFQPAEFSHLIMNVKGLSTLRSFVDRTNVISSLFVLHACMVHRASEGSKLLSSRFAFLRTEDSFGPFRLCL